jgi:hypothetical protein
MSSLDIDGSKIDTVLGHVGGLGSSAIARDATRLATNDFEYIAIVFNSERDVGRLERNNAIIINYQATIFTNNTSSTSLKTENVVEVRFLVTYLGLNTSTSSHATCDCK